MGTESRRADPSVEQSLFDEGHRFEFFEAVRLLERILSDRQPVGRSGHPKEEVVRFRANPTLSFPGSEVQQVVRPNGAHEPAQMIVNFMGLIGPEGVLPRHYTELVMNRLREKDRALGDFLDLFNHRMISLFYRAWEKHRFPVPYERTIRHLAQDDEGDACYDLFSRHLFDLIGLGTRGVRDRLGVHGWTLLSYVGLLAQQPRSATALEGFLAGYFEVRVVIVQFLGQWLPLSVVDRTQIGQRNSILGESAVVGNWVWDQQARFRVRLGPLSFVQFCALLPSGDSFRPLVLLTRIFVGQQYDFDVQLILRAAEVPACRLGEGGERAPRLGWSTWLKVREFTTDSEDVVLRGSQTLTGTFPDERIDGPGRS